MPLSLHIIYASTSGNTEYVVDTLTTFLREQSPDLKIEVQRAERAESLDLLRGDAVILGSGTWNTGGTEGQLNPHMYALLLERAADADLHGKPLAFVSLGDDRYYFTTRCTEHFQRFLRTHNGKQLLPPLVIVNEPYGQEEKIHKWGKKLLSSLTLSLP
ncbi:flavodoxin family protein [Candidatus Peregrinibacteria bacterium]|nr:flavodoxin family protein [Candidatus Peregrinibacteria bacterium]